MVKVPSHCVSEIEIGVKLAYAVDPFLRGIVRVELGAELVGTGLYDFFVELRRRMQTYPNSDVKLRI